MAKDREIEERCVKLLKDAIRQFSRDTKENSFTFSMIALQRIAAGFAKIDPNTTADVLRAMSHQYTAKTTTARASAIKRRNSSLEKLAARDVLRAKYLLALRRAPTAGTG